MHHDEYRIRTATDAELGLLAAIEQKAGMLFGSTRHAYVCSGPFVPHAVAEERWRTGFVFAAVDRQEHVVGFALGGELAGEAFLQELDVEPAHGRRGLGRRLLRAAVEWAATRGYRTVVLSTFADVAWNAPFYRRVGFEPIPEDQLTQAMQAVRNDERKAGLLLASRVFLRLNVSAMPTNGISSPL